jgi:hypothetical protein
MCILLAVSKWLEGHTRREAVCELVLRLEPGGRAGLHLTTQCDGCLVDLETFTRTAVVNEPVDWECLAHNHCFLKLMLWRPVVILPRTFLLPWLFTVYAKYCIHHFILAILSVSRGYFYI